VVTVFGELLRNSRLRAVLTQEELAERAGLSVREVGKLESGETTRPRPATVRMLADALGLYEPELTSFIASAFGIRQLRPVPQNVFEKRGAGRPGQPEPAGSPAPAAHMRASQTHSQRSKTSRAHASRLVSSGRAAR
jgi:transcriptional regulator with XRE-family HTH domain